MGKELEWTSYEDMLKRVEAEKAKEKEDDCYDRGKRGTGLPGRNRNCKTSKSSGNKKLYIDLLNGFKEIAADVQASDEVVETIDELVAEATNNDTANNA